MVRFKNRYLLCEIQWEDRKYDPNVRNKDLYDAIRDSVGMNFGDLGMGAISTSLSSNFYIVKYWNPVTNLAIVRIQREEFRMLWCAITFITHIRGRKVRPKIIYTAGTIRTCQREVVRVIREWIVKSHNVLEKRKKEAQAEEMMEELGSIVP